MARRCSFVKRTNKKNRNRTRTRNRTNKKNRTKRINQKGGAIELKNTLEGQSGRVWSVAFHPTAPLMATGFGDKTAKLWRFSPAGSTEPECVATLAEHSNSVRSVAFHPTESLLATGSADNTAKLWNIEV